MASWEIRSGGSVLDLAAEAAAGRQIRDTQPDPAPSTTLRRSGPVLVALTCALSLVAIVAAAGRSSIDGGAETVSVLAIVAVALTTARWRPDPSVAPTRGVPRQLALAMTASAVLVVLLLVWGLDPIGPAISLAVVSAYLAVWGYRALALLRSVIALTVLAWPPIAGVVYDMAWASLDQPSGVVYARLSELALFGVDAEPWRLYTAMLHRGALVVIATLVFAVTVNRWRASVRTMVDLVVTIAAALVAHHALVLASGLDAYDPTNATQVATHPILEVAVAGTAVAALTAIRARRTSEIVVERPTDVHGDDRDPVIFDPGSSITDARSTALLLTGVLPLILVAAMS